MVINVFVFPEYLGAASGLHKIILFVANVSSPSVEQMFVLHSYVYIFLSRSEEQGNPLIEQFIARKADILFCQASKTVTHQEDTHEEEEEAAGIVFFYIIDSQQNKINFKAAKHCLLKVLFSKCICFQCVFIS